MQDLLVSFYAMTGDKCARFIGICICDAWSQMYDIYRYLYNLSARAPMTTNLTGPQPVPERHSGRDLHFAVLEVGLTPQEGGHDWRENPELGGISHAAIVPVNGTIPVQLCIQKMC